MHGYSVKNRRCIPIFRKKDGVQKAPRGRSSTITHITVTGDGNNFADIRQATDDL